MKKQKKKGCFNRDRNGGNELCLRNIKSKFM